MKSNGNTKKKILGYIFSEKVVLEKGRVATTLPLGSYSGFNQY